MLSQLGCRDKFTGPLSEPKAEGNPQREAACKERRKESDPESRISIHRLPKCRF
jgi:hypothetical protein